MLSSTHAVWMWVCKEGGVGCVWGVGMINGSERKSITQEPVQLKKGYTGINKTLLTK